MSGETIIPKVVVEELINRAAYDLSVKDYRDWVNQSLQSLSGSLTQSQFDKIRDLYVSKYSK
jgi:hypothetical protein